MWYSVGNKASHIHNLTVHKTAFEMQSRKAQRQAEHEGCMQMEKKDILIKNGTYNKNHSKVKNERFREGGFYDPMDIVQVRYEMIKDAEDRGGAIGQATGEYGYSRASYYNIKDDFEKGGMTGLVPDKRGPKTPRKLTGDLQDFIKDYVKGDPSASPAKIAAAIEAARGVTVSKRTVERFFSKKKL